MLTACNTKSGKKPTERDTIPKVSPSNYSIKKTLIPIKATDTSDVAKEIVDETATYFIVVADTGTDYYQLREKMLSIHQALNTPIDTMGRYYNKAKDLIALPDNDSDEIYAGDYFPRRYPTNFLSLEYMVFYKPASDKNTIALISGIYDNKKSADSALMILKPVQDNAFAIKASIYVGCMH
jgi:hypothetical protein